MAREQEPGRGPHRIRVFTAAGIAAVLLVLAVLIPLGYGQEWTGLGRSVVRVGEDRDLRRAKTLWDWLELLVVPAALAVGVFLLDRAQRRREAAGQQAQRDRELEVEERRRKRELETEDQRAQDAALQSYLDQMGALLGEGLGTPEERTADRTVARARTLTVLRRLDAPRKGDVVQFLYEAGLIRGERPVVGLADANLIGVGLSGTREFGEYGSVSLARLEEVNLEGALLFDARLAGAYMSDARLSLAEMGGASLLQARLRGADLSVARLRGADLVGADLEGANLGNADLSGAKLKEAKLGGASLAGATLHGVDLAGADLGGADLDLADLGGADLRFAEGLTQQQIDGAFGTSRGSGGEKGRPDTKLPVHLQAPASWGKPPREQIAMKREQLNADREQLEKERERLRGGD